MFPQAPAAAIHGHHVPSLRSKSSPSELLGPQEPPRSFQPSGPGDGRLGFPGLVSGHRTVCLRKNDWNNLWKLWKWDQKEAECGSETQQCKKLSSARNCAEFVSWYFNNMLRYPTFRSRKNSFRKNIWMVPVKKTRASPSIPVVTHNVKPKVAVFYLNSYLDVFWSSPSSPLFFPTCTKVHVCCALVLVVSKNYACIIHIFDVCDRSPNWQVWHMVCHTLLAESPMFSSPFPIFVGSVNILWFFIVQSPTFPFHNPTNPLTLVHLGLYRPYEKLHFAPKMPYETVHHFFLVYIIYLLQISTFPFHLHFLKE